MAATLEGFKAWAVIDGDRGDAAANAALAAAKAYFTGAGAVEPITTDADYTAEMGGQYELGVYMLAAHYYDQPRGDASFPPGVAGIIDQLRYRPAPDQEGGTQ